MDFPFNFVAALPNYHMLCNEVKSFTRPINENVVVVATATRTVNIEQL